MSKFRDRSPILRLGGGGVGRVGGWVCVCGGGGGAGMGSGGRAVFSFIKDEYDDWSIYPVINERTCDS